MPGGKVTFRSMEQFTAAAKKETAADVVTDEIRQEFPNEGNNGTRFRVERNGYVHMIGPRGRSSFKNWKMFWDSTQI